MPSLAHSPDHESKSSRNAASGPSRTSRRPRTGPLSTRSRQRSPSTEPDSAVASTEGYSSANQHTKDASSRSRTQSYSRTTSISRRELAGNVQASSEERTPSKISSKSAYNRPGDLQASMFAKSFGTFSPYDARVAAHLPDGIHFVSSSNVTFIPELPSPSSETPRCRKDGRLGPHCYTLWPQLVKDDLAHRVCIPRRPVDTTDPTYNDIMWVRVDQERDWQRVGPLKDGIEVGHLDGWIIGMLTTSFRALEEEISAVVKELEKAQKFPEASLPNMLSKCLKRNVVRLQETRLSLRESIETLGEAQDLILELKGYLSHRRIVLSLLRGGYVAHPREPLPVLGGFTFDRKVVEWMCFANIPCWYIREYHRIKADGIYTAKIIKPSRMEHVISMEDWLDISQSNVPPRNIPQRSKPPVNEQHTKTERKKTKHPTVQTSSVRRVPDTHSKVFDASTSADSSNSGEPQMVALWAVALSSLSSSKADKEPTKRGLYSLPPPNMFYQSTLRYRFMLNYLRARDNLHSFLSSFSTPLSKLRADDWRLGLLGETPKHALGSTSLFDSRSSWPFQLEVREAREYVKGSFLESLYDSVPWFEDLSAEWEDRTITFNTLSLDHTLWASLLWEIHEIGYRLDFVDLHLAEMCLERGRSPSTLVEAEITRCLRVFSDSGSLLPKQTDPLSVCWEMAELTMEHEHLRNFLLVISEWPLAPPSLRNLPLSPEPGSNIKAVIREAMCFFCERFILRFGRKPILPVFRPAI